MTMCRSYARIGQREDAIIRSCMSILSSAASTRRPTDRLLGSGRLSGRHHGPDRQGVDAGDVMIIDTGSVFDGYYCDFNRNWAFGRATDEAKRAYELC